MDSTISYELKRTRRRTIALRVDPSGTVTVLAPTYTLKFFIERFVQKQAEWIRKKREYFEQFKKKHPIKHFVAGESFPVWGDDSSPRILADPVLDQKWFKQQTEEKLLEMLPVLAAKMEVRPGRITVAKQRKRWGSCSRSGNLRFNWRLSMMPPAILEYVIVHELAHIRSHDHSNRFWSIVESILPDFKIRRRWLREHGSYLSV